MSNYIKLNEDRWNNVKNDYTEPEAAHEYFCPMRSHGRR